MGLEYRAQADATSQNLLNERNKEVITFNPECGQSNATLDKKARRSRKALPLPCSFLYNKQFFFKLATRNNEIIDLTYIVDRAYKIETLLNCQPNTSLNSLSFLLQCCPCLITFSDRYIFVFFL